MMELCHAHPNEIKYRIKPETEDNAKIGEGARKARRGREGGGAGGKRRGTREMGNVPIYPSPWRFSRALLMAASSSWATNGFMR